MKLKSRSAECVVCNYKRARSLFTGQVLFEHRFPLYRVFVFQARINCHCVFLSRASEKPPGLEKTCHSSRFKKMPDRSSQTLPGVVELTAAAVSIKFFLSISIQPLLVKMFRSRNWVLFRLTGLDVEYC